MSRPPIPPSVRPSSRSRVTRREPPHRPRSAGPPRSPRGPRRFPGLLLFLLGFLAGAGSLYYFGCRDAGRKPRESPPVAGTPGGRPRSTSPGSSKSGPGRRSLPVDPTAPTAPAPGEGEPGAGPASGSEVPGGAPPRVAIVIDDLGRSLEEIDTLARLGVPVTYSVLPFESETPQVVAALHQRGAEVLCHLPMQPRNGQNPGPGALLYGMDSATLERTTAAALAAVPGAVGVNNHMGSRLSADAPSMRAVLGVLSRRGLFFLDSRTSPESVGYKVAGELGLAAAERQVFLDAEMSDGKIREQFQRTLELARQRGGAIAIGHPHRGTLAVLAALVPLAREQGYEFVTVSHLLDRPRGAAAR